MSDVVWQAIIAALLAAYMEWSRRKTADRVAAEAKKVKDTLAASDEAVIAKLDDNAVKTDSIAETTVELHKQGNSRWDEIKAELVEANKKIDALQQLRVEEAKTGALKGDQPTTPQSRRPIR